MWQILFKTRKPHEICVFPQPNHNPFTGAPETERLDGGTVRVTWGEVFPRGRGCDDVEFLIKADQTGVQ